MPVLTIQLPDRISGALRGLTASIDRLEAAAERRGQADAARADIEQELTLMQEDRARLAEALDASQARAERLTDVQGAVSQRLDRISAALRSLIEVTPDGAPTVDR